MDFEDEYRKMPPELRKLFERSPPSRMYWRLNARGEPQVCAKMKDWYQWMHEAYAVEKWARLRMVGRDQVGPYDIRTDFLGLDHGWGQAQPVLWETMIFTQAPNHKLNNEMDRCSGSREQALAMHARMVARCRKLVGVKVAKK